MNTDNRLETTVEIRTVHIACNAIKGEIVTTIQHDPETYRVGDASENRSDERVTIQTRSFPIYRVPGHDCKVLARSMRDYALSIAPKALVELHGA